MLSTSPSGASSRMLAVLVLAFSLFSAPQSAFAEKTLGVSSGSFKYELDAGGQTAGEIVVSNDGDEPITVLVYAADQLVDDAGAITFSVPNRADLSTIMSQPSAWARIDMPADSKSFANVPYLELEPGERLPVHFQINVPGGVAPGDHNVMVFFEMAELPTDNNSGAQMRVSGRIGSRITLRVNGQLVERTDVRPFTVPAVVFGPVIPFKLRVLNEGNVDQRMTVKAMLLDGSDNTVSEAVPVDAQTVFAGRNLETSGTVVASRFGFGPHTVRVEAQRVDENGAVLNAGNDTIRVTRTAWVLPLWLLLAVGVVLLMIVGIVGIVARSATRRRAAAAPATPVGPSEPDATP